MMITPAAGGTGGGILSCHAIQMKIRVMLKKSQKILKDVGLSTSSEFFIRDGQKKGILSFSPNFYPFFNVCAKEGG